MVKNIQLYFSPCFFIFYFTRNPFNILKAKLAIANNFILSLIIYYKIIQTK